MPGARSGANRFKNQFKRFDTWRPHVSPGGWPDAEILPPGIVPSEIRLEIMLLLRQFGKYQTPYWLEVG